MKSVVKKIIGEDAYLKLAIEYNKFKNNKLLKDNFKVDYSLYKEHSTIFNSDTFTKVETSIILDYHGIEKGLLHEEIRFRFAKGRIERLQKNLKLLMEKKENFNSQIIVAFQLLCQYYEVHEEANVNIEDFFTLKTYNQYKDILSDSYSSDFDGVIQKKAEDFYADIAGNFSEFSNSRHSIRSFKQELIEIDIIEQVINLATNAPSVCNRQSSKVYLINEKIKVDTVLKIQGGFNGFSEKIPQVLILTSNRNCFYDIGERNQMYVDGGIFLMNLLYSLHYYKIGGCPGNWAKTSSEDIQIRNLLNLPKEEKVICVIPIGYVEDSVKYCLSKRRNVNEIFSIIK